MEAEEERRTRLENDAATKPLKLAMELDEEREARLEKMVATAQLIVSCSRPFPFYYEEEGKGRLRETTQLMLALINPFDLKSV